MTRYIDADDIQFITVPIAPLSKRDHVHYEKVVFKRGIENAPTIDAVPVRHGKWIHEVRYTIDSLHSYQQYRCSECDMTYITNTKYCPNCGARMVEDE